MTIETLTYCHSAPDTTACQDVVTAKFTVLIQLAFLTQTILKSEKLLHLCLPDPDIPRWHDVRHLRICPCVFRRKTLPSLRAANDRAPREYV